VRVLSPAQDWKTTSQPRNNDSLVLHFTYGQSAALLEGDAERKIEESVATQQPRADLLKVAHHGALTSSIPELLRAVSPRRRLFQWDREILSVIPASGYCKDWLIHMWQRIALIWTARLHSIWTGAPSLLPWWFIEI